MTEKADQGKEKPPKELPPLPTFAFVTGLIRYTTGVVCLAAYALSFVAFLAWLYVTVTAVVSAPVEDGKQVIHQLLQSIELLLIVPIPAVIGVVVYQTLIQVADPSNPQLEASHAQVSVAKSLLAGLLVTVTGTTLLDALILGNYDLEPFIGGALLIVGLSVYVFVANRR